MRMISNPRIHVRKTIIALILIVVSPALVHGAVIFSDNFDNDCTGNACNVIGGTSNVPTGWNQWYADSIGAIYDSVTHYSGEISSPGRGGNGKSLKLWRYSYSWTGSASYAGSLLFTSPGSYSNFFLRFYAKIPTDMVLPPDTKMFRLNTSAGEIYINLNGDGSGRGGTYLLAWGASGDSTVNTTLLNKAQISTLWDGNWHCWEFQFDLTAGTVTFWGDGIQLGTLTDSRLKQGTWNNYLQHFPLGNAQQGSFQSAWRAFEVDDFVLSTTYVGPDNTAPIAKQPKPPVDIKLN